MTFHLIGVNHKTAPVEVRERLALPESRLPEACKSLCQQDGIEEGLILSTCNRVELLVRSVTISTSIQQSTSATSMNMGKRTRFGTSFGSPRASIPWW